MGRIYGANGSMALMDIAERTYREPKKDAKPKVRKMRDTNVKPDRKKSS